MIMIAFFDVGETLLHDGQLFPGVTTALAAVAKIESADAPLVLGIISDYFMPDPPPTEDKIAALEAQYRKQVLEPNGLTGFFQPFESRVTISSRVGVFKPARKIFEAAVARTGTGASLHECLFVTEATDHLEKAREYGMTPVRFGPVSDEMPGFESWADAPAVIAGLVNPGHAGNRAVAAAALAARHGLIDFTPAGGGGGTVHGRANQLVQLNDTRLGPLDGVYVELPTQATVDFGPDGRAKDVVATPPGQEEVADAVNYVSSLIKSHKVIIPGHPPPAFGATHMAEKGPDGRLRLVRRGYTAR